MSADGATLSTSAAVRVGMTFATGTPAAISHRTTMPSTPQVRRREPVGATASPPSPTPLTGGPPASHTTRTMVAV